MIVLLNLLKTLILYLKEDHSGIHSPSSLARTDQNTLNKTLTWKRKKVTLNKRTVQYIILNEYVV